MSGSPTRWAIVGAGRISSDFLTGLSFLSSDEHKAVAVGSRSLERSAEFAKKFGIPRSYGSYEELAADKEIDVIYMGVIHPSHYPLMKLFLNSGHNVICEKPFTTNSTHSKEVVELARQKKLFLMEGFWSRFYPVYDDLRKELQDKTIGEPKYVMIKFGKRYVESDDHAEWLNDQSLGAGVLMSLGCYCIMFSQLVFNHEMPEKITASGILNEQHGYDELVNITLSYSNNRVANIVASKLYTLDNTACIFGDKDMIKVVNFWSPEEIITPQGSKHHPLPKAKHKTFYANGEGFMYEAESVRQCLLKGLTENPLMTLDQTLQIQKIIDEVKSQIGIKYKQDP